LKDSGLDDFDMMLSGYVPSAEAVRVVGAIAQDLKLKATMKPGSFFWVLDPVIGDNGKIYVAEDCVPAYKELVQHADLILPNQYEAEYVFLVLLLLKLEMLTHSYTDGCLVFRSLTLEPFHKQ
jgi:pyridoxine kinase